MKTFEIEAREATIKGNYNRNKISLSFDAEPSEVAGLLTIEEALTGFNFDDLLDAIGIEKVKAHFGLVDEDA